MDYPRPYGDYTLLEHLGAGGMSTVELARRSVGDNDYVRFAVIKRVLARRAEEEESARMFLDEARINSELHHENIAGIYDFGFRDDEFYLVMEYVPGMDLRQVQRALFRRDQGIPLRTVFTILDKVLAGLEHAHGAVDTLGRPMRIVHRDINPRNIMLSTRGDVKIIDFGLAKAEHRVEETVGDVVKGKFSYMAPEQVEARAVDGRTDLFAVGLMLQELVNGKQNFKGLTHIQIVHRILAGRFDEMHVPADFEFPARLQAIRSRALAMDPDDRYPGAAEMRRDLATVAPLAGGFLTRGEMAQFMRHVDEHRVSAIGDRLANYRTSQVSAVVTPPAVPPDLVVSESEEAPETSGTLIADKPVSGGLKPAHVLVLMALGGVLTGAAVLALTGGEEPLPEPTTVVTPAPAPVEAAPAPEPEPAPEVAEPVPAPKKAAPSKKTTSTPKKATSTAQPEPDPEPAAPEPEVDPEPVVADPEGGESPSRSEGIVRVELEPEPEPEPAPEPEVTAEGYLYVSSRPSNLEVRIDGKPIGRTPIKLYKLPVGDYLLVVVDGATGQESKHNITIAEGRPAKVMAKLE